MNEPQEPSGHGVSLADAVGPFWSAEHAAHVLGLNNVEQLSAAASSGRVLVCRTSDHVPVVPVWQFEHHDGRVRVRPHIAAVLTVLRHHDPWSVGLLILSEGLATADLSDTGPLDVQEDADLEKFVRWAKVVDAEWSV